MNKPTGKWKCRACGNVCDGSELHLSTRHAHTWTCSNIFCEGTCDPVKEKSKLKTKKLLYKKGATEYYQEFFSSLEPGEFFIYSSTWIPREIVELAATFDTTVRYCEPRSPGYIQHCCMEKI